MYFGHYRKLVYLSQEEDLALQEEAKRRRTISGLNTSTASPAMAISRPR
ncbi:hypothetical protein SAMN03159448_04577 [Sinorhizobium sp. NFACC03]|jgi:hypothetical protein|nr:hypothetical protein SAMN03159448_04577 [Sinorhizobium sp. NFACC03]